eukprot:g6838.t1
MLYAGFGALLFSGYIVLDTQLIIGGKHSSFQFGTEDYVMAAITIYLDIINLFLYILSLFGDRHRALQAACIIILSMSAKAEVDEMQAGYISLKAEAAAEQSKAKIAKQTLKERDVRVAQLLEEQDKHRSQQNLLKDEAAELADHRAWLGEELETWTASELEDQLLKERVRCARRLEDMSEEILQEKAKRLELQKPGPPERERQQKELGIAPDLFRYQACSRKFIQIVRENPCIKGWFSGHFHLSHDYEDSITFPGGNRRGHCVFAQTGVMRSKSSRDGRQQSRLVRGNSQGYEMYTIDHKKDGELRLDATVLYSDSCDEDDGCLVEPRGTLNRDGVDLDFANGDQVCWWHMKDGAILGVHGGMILEYDASTFAPLGMVVSRDELQNRRVAVIDDGYGWLVQET